MPLCAYAFDTHAVAWFASTSGLYPVTNGIQMGIAWYITRVAPKRLRTTLIYHYTLGCWFHVSQSLFGVAWTQWFHNIFYQTSMAHWLRATRWCPPSYKWGFNPPDIRRPRLSPRQRRRLGPPQVWSLFLLACHYLAVALWRQTFVVRALKLAVCLHAPLLLGRSSLPFASRQMQTIPCGSLDQALRPLPLCCC